MPRYTRQRNQTDCGPTAVINALKWLGFKVSYAEHAKTAKKLCKWIPNDGGSYNTNIFNAFRKMCKDKASLTRYACTTMSVIDIVKSGNAAFLTHYAYDSVYHISLLIPTNNPNYPFALVNSQLIYDGPVLFYMDEWEIKRLLLKKSTDAYIIKKK